jgi:hypothetical protein
MNSPSSILDISKEVSEKFAKFEDEFAQERAAFFNCLTKEQKLLVFCEVVHKLVNAELVKHQSYRGVLYEEFGFETDSYMLAQISGFLELHNSIESESVDLNEFGMKLLNLYGIKQTKEDVENKIKTEVDKNRSIEEEIRKSITPDN